MSSKMYKLELVLNPKGKPRPVAKCAWLDDPNRTSPQLQHVGQAKPRLRALLILLLLSKYRLYLSKAESHINYNFIASSAESNWISNLAEGVKNTGLHDWIEERFQLPFGSKLISTVRSGGAKKVSSVEYVSEILPPENISIYVKGDLGSKDRELKEKDLLFFAYELEEYSTWASKIIRPMFLSDFEQTTNKMAAPIPSREPAKQKIIQRDSQFWIDLSKEAVDKMQATRAPWSDMTRLWVTWATGNYINSCIQEWSRMPRAKVLKQLAGMLTNAIESKPKGFPGIDNKLSVD